MIGWFEQEALVEEQSWKETKVAEIKAVRGVKHGIWIQIVG